MYTINCDVDHIDLWILEYREFTVPRGSLTAVYLSKGEAERSSILKVIGADPSLSRSSTDRGMLRRPYCHYFNTTGKCRFGRHCKFLHDSAVLNIEPQLNSLIQDEAVNSEIATQLNQGSISNSRSSESIQGNHESISQDTVSADLSTVSISETSKDTASKDGSLSKESKLDNSVSLVTSDLPFCKYYAQYRFCRYGKNCRFQHVIPKRSGQRNDLKDGANNRKDEDKVQNEETKSIESATKDKLLKPEVTTEDRNKQSKRVCFYYKQGYCKYGRNCNFLHPGWKKPEQAESKEEAKVNDEKKVTSASEEKSAIVKTPQIIHCYKRDEVTSEKLREMRATEIRQLKRRFTTENLRCVEENETNAKFVFTFSPTDPDWPFEVKLFDIAVQFTDDYPLKLFSLSVPEDQDLPETVRRYIEVSLEEWVKMKEEQAITKGNVELLFRPFLRWLDRNMEELVTQALKQLRRELTAKAAGLEFVSASELRKEYNHDSSEEQAKQEDDHDSKRDEKLEEKGIVVYKKSDKEKEEEVYEVPHRERKESEKAEEDEDDDERTDSEEERDETEHRRPPINLDTERRGTELSFRNMQIWFCTTVMMEKLQLTIQCERCKNTTEFSTPPNRVNSITCGKCHAVQLVVFRPVLAHSYSSTFGYLDLDGCIVFDVNLQECHFSMGCIRCNRDLLIKHCTPGKLLEPFCRQCHNKMQFASESVKMTKLTTDVEQSYCKVHQVNAKKLKKAAKDPAIQEGKPLPNNGTCKHYKKSYRWLRFPCCGKCYACDVCHDDNEDHEMKYANRMICGFCCREQPYAAEKPCLGCSSALTKVRTTHWEGGRGCRDKISMSRNDNQKYANLNKTVSRKSMASKEKAKGKKNTKLRHT